MSIIHIHGRPFKMSIPQDEILERVQAMAAEIDANYAGKHVLLLPVMNGALPFAADLMRCLTSKFELECIKTASYEGVTSTGQVDHLLGIPTQTLAGKHVLLLEDIIDTGTTLHKLLPGLLAAKPASLQVAALLSKPEARKFEVPCQFTGFSVPNIFFLGYGMDYDGAGRGLRDLWVLAEH